MQKWFLPILAALAVAVVLLAIPLVWPRVHAEILYGRALSKDPQVAVEAVRALAAYPSDRTTAVLLHLVELPREEVDERVRVAAVEVLIAHEQETNTVSVSGLLRLETPAETRFVIAEALARQSSGRLCVPSVYDHLAELWSEQRFMRTGLKPPPPEGEAAINKLVQEKLLFVLSREKPVTLEYAGAFFRHHLDMEERMDVGSHKVDEFPIWLAAQLRFPEWCSHLRHYRAGATYEEDQVAISAVISDLQCPN